MLFQRDNIVLSAAKDGLYSTKLQLRAMIARPGKNLQDFLDEVGDGHIKDDQYNHPVLEFQILKAWIQIQFLQLGRFLIPGFGQNL